MSDDTGVKMRPILFSGEMVKALLDGRKTQTRRVLKPQPGQISSPVFGGGAMTFQNPEDVEPGDDERWFGYDDTEGDWVEIGKCPYGQPGDRLWVRESCRWDHSESDIHYRADGQTRRFLTSKEADEWSRRDWERRHRHAQWNARWRPSIHMPRWASRITLEVEEVRVQRVQEISLEDVGAEGFEWRGCPDDYDQGLSGTFIHIWDSLNAKRGYGWDTNPWVWALTFKRVEE